MAGCPIRRARKAEVRAEDGSIIAFPRLSHPRAGLPHASWRVLGPAEKIERLLGMSLDRCYEILSWSPGEIDPHRLNMLVQVWRVVFMIGVKAMLDGTLGREAARERDRERVIANLARDFRRGIPPVDS